MKEVELVARIHCVITIGQRGDKTTSTFEEDCPLIQVQELTCTTLATELLELRTVAIFGLQVARVAGEVSRSTSNTRAKGPDVSSVKSPFFVSGEHECFSSELQRFEGFLCFGRPAYVVFDIVGTCDPFDFVGKG